MPVFHTGVFPLGGCGKLRHGKFQIGEKQIAPRDRFVECKEKPSTFFFMKGRMSTFLPRTYQKTTSGITACIAVPASDCGKPGGKSGKPHGKLPAFFTKTVENPVEKVKSSFRNGNSIHFTVVEKCPKSRLTAVFFGVWAKVSHRLNGPDNHGTITAKNCGKNPTILEASL